MRCGRRRPARPRGRRTSPWRPACAGTAAGRLLGEIEVVADDHRHRRLAGSSRRCPGRASAASFSLASWRGHPDEAGRADVGRGRARLRQVVDRADVLGVTGSSVQPLRVRAARKSWSIARRAEGLAQCAEAPSVCGAWRARRAARASARPGSLPARSAAACSRRPTSGWPPTTGSPSRRRACAAKPRRSPARSG